MAAKDTKETTGATLKPSAPSSMTMLAAVVAPVICAAVVCGVFLLVPTRANTAAAEALSVQADSVAELKDAVDALNAADDASEKQLTDMLAECIPEVLPEKPELLSGADAARILKLCHGKGAKKRLNLVLQLKAAKLPPQ